MCTCLLAVRGGELTVNAVNARQSYETSKTIIESLDFSLPSALEHVVRVLSVNEVKNVPCRPSI